MPGQLVLTFPPPPPPEPPPIPKPRAPSLAPLPDRRPRGPAGVEFDALAALCVCPCCAVTFADEPALLAHRRNGRCLTPEAAGLTHQPRHDCWGREETT